MKTLKKNEEIKGKIVTFKTFREQLLSEMSKSFPDEYKEYTRIREEEKRDQQEQDGQEGASANLMSNLESNIKQADWTGLKSL